MYSFTHRHHIAVVYQSETLKLLTGEVKKHRLSTCQSGANQQTASNQSVLTLVDGVTPFCSKNVQINLFGNGLLKDNNSTQLPNLPVFFLLADPFGFCFCHQL